MNRMDRLYALVEELRAVAPRPLPARRLASRYEVSTRTIERDILALQEAGVPVYAVTGRSGGYVIDKRRTLPPLNFTAAEMAAMAVCLAAAEATPFASALRSALRKVLTAAPPAQTAQAAQLLDRVRLVRTGAGKAGAGKAGTGKAGAGDTTAKAIAAPDGASLDGTAGTAVPAAIPLPAAVPPPVAVPPPAAVPLAIQEAITARHVLRLSYRDRAEAVTVREVEPVAFAGTPAHWYLLAWCRLRGGPRAFRTDRIHAVSDTGEPAPYRSFADLEVGIPAALLRRVDLAG